MIAKTYPRLSARFITQAHPGTRCTACDRPAMFRIEVEMSELRDDNAIHPVCTGHASLARDEFGEFMKVVQQVTA